MIVFERRESQIRPFSARDLTEGEKRRLGRSVVTSCTRLRWISDLTQVLGRPQGHKRQLGVKRRRDRQLNLRVDDDLLTSLREASGLAGEGYHTFARRLIEDGVARALAEPGEAPSRGAQSHRLRMKEVLFVLLGSARDTAQGKLPQSQAELVYRSCSSSPRSICNRTWLRGSRRTATVRFEESIETDVDFLSSEGLIEATGRQTLPEVRTYDPERGKRIVEWVRSERVGS